MDALDGITIKVVEAIDKGYDGVDDPSPLAKNGGALNTVTYDNVYLSCIRLARYIGADAIKVYYALNRQKYIDSKVNMTALAKELGICRPWAIQAFNNLCVLQLIVKDGKKRSLRPRVVLWEILRRILENTENGKSHPVDYFAEYDTGGMQIGTAKPRTARGKLFFRAHRRSLDRLLTILPSKHFVVLFHLAASGYAKKPKAKTNPNVSVYIQALAGDCGTTNKGIKSILNDLHHLNLIRFSGIARGRSRTKAGALQIELTGIHKLRINKTHTLNKLSPEDDSDDAAITLDRMDDKLRAKKIKSKEGRAELDELTKTRQVKLDRRKLFDNECSAFLDSVEETWKQLEATGTPSPNVIVSRPFHGNQHTDAHTAETAFLLGTEEKPTQSPLPPAAHQTIPTAVPRSAIQMPTEKQDSTLTDSQLKKAIAAFAHLNGQLPTPAHYTTEAAYLKYHESRQEYETVCLYATQEAADRINRTGIPDAEVTMRKMRATGSKEDDIKSALSGVKAGLRDNLILQTYMKHRPKDNASKYTEKPDALDKDNGRTLEEDLDVQLYFWTTNSMSELLKDRQIVKIREWFAWAVSMREAKYPESEYKASRWCLSSDAPPRGQRIPEPIPITLLHET